MPEVNNFAELEVLLDKCQAALNYRFRDIELLAMCLTHASSARTRLHSNERLEFFGDAVLGLVVCEALYQRFPEAAEGELTRIKSIVVSRATCATMASRVRLEEFVLVGKGLDHGGHIPSSILAGTFEGLIAGIYLDGGLEAARSFLMPLLNPEIESSAGTLHTQNFKSLLQHIAQKKLGSTPMYRVLDERGPDHSKVFHISAVVAGRVFPAAWGSNKKEAEQTAAQHALEELLGEDAAEGQPASIVGDTATANPENIHSSESADTEVCAVAITDAPEPFGYGVENS
ncbi:MAG: ribonuclease III [Planctomycetes bacterium]|nr:ribonuclease III [Planctomycetota bacterium]